MFNLFWKFQMFIFLKGAMLFENKRIRLKRQA